jgi:hypothetical protein
MTIDKFEFAKMFEAYNRKENFTIEALNALFDYLEDIDPNYELDVIGLCCEWSEYESKKEAKEAYGLSWEELKDSTTVIEVSEDCYLIQEF